MTNKFFVITIISLFFSLQLFSQEKKCEVICQFIDDESGMTIPQYQISTNLEDGTRYQPDDRGNFKMEFATSPEFLFITLGDSVHRIAFKPDDCGVMKVFRIKTNTLQTSEVQVSAFRYEKNVLEIPASIGVVKRNIITSTDQFSLQNALNQVSGVIMESRGYGGSHRISIRGSALRSPFAVRNIKMYADGIPLTSPDGQAPFEMIDAADIERIEVIKGPSGSIYGSGNGGVLLYQIKRALPGKNTIGSGAQMGTFGAYRSHEFAEIGTRNGGFRISHVWQDYEGYREQEFNRKNQVSLHFNQYISEKQKVTFFGTYYSGKWGLPGALSGKQVLENPTQAVPFSLANNAYLNRNRLFGGLSHRFNISSALTETTSIYYYSTSKLNPYGTSAFNSGYKDEGADGFGGRTDWTLTKSYLNHDIKFNFGGEWQSEKFNIVEKTIVNSQPGEFKYLYDIGYISSMAFASLIYEFNDIFFIDLGASYNKTDQDVRGLNDDNFKFDTLATWDGTILPRLATAIKLSKNFTLFHSIGTGNANPTVFEMIDYENNAYNLQLRPEKGSSQEIGLKHRIESIGLNYELSFYEFQLNDAILAYTVSNGNDTRNYYHNAGETNQRGLEWSLNWNYELAKDILELEFTSSGSVFSYKYKRYEVSDAHLTGKRIAGVPLTNAVHGIHASLFKQIKISIQNFWFDRTPLDNSNTVWSAPYHLLNARIAWVKNFTSHWQAGIHAGMNNLLDSSYTSNFNLNAVGDKYYNPSAPQNWFLGLNVQYRLAK